MLLLNFALLTSGHTPRERGILVSGAVKDYSLRIAK